MLGIMHYDPDGAPDFVFDMMEPERPKVDRVVLDFVKATVFDPTDFTIRTDGVVRLNPEMARIVVTIAAAQTGSELLSPSGRSQRRYGPTAFRNSGRACSSAIAGLKHGHHFGTRRGNL